MLFEKGCHLAGIEISEHELTECQRRGATLAGEFLHFLVFRAIRDHIDSFVRITFAFEPCFSVDAPWAAGFDVDDQGFGVS